MTETMEVERGLLQSLKKERVSHALARTAGVPVVKQAAEFLSGAQLEWVSGPANEITIQNPVYLKHKRNQEVEKNTPSESVLASHEVRGLAENVIPGLSSTNHGGIERLNERRKTKHEACVARAQEQIGQVAKQLEPRILEVTQDMKQQLAEYDKEYDAHWARLRDDEWLVEQNAAVLDGVRDALIDQLPQRQAIVDHLDFELERLERERSSLVAAILDNAASDLEEIAFMLPDGVSRWVESEMLDMNDVIIKNRKAYAELHARLMRAEVLREAHAMEFWQQRASTWCDLKKQRAIHSLTLLLTGPEALDPSARRRLFEQLNEEQGAHLKRRTDFLRTVSETHPPGCTRSTGREWTRTLAQLDDRLEAMHANMMELFREQEQNFRDHLAARLAETVSDLISSGVFVEEADARSFIEPIARPLLTERDMEADRLLAAVQVALNKHRESLKEPCSTFVEFASGSAGLWTEHEGELRQVETTLQERLERTRAEHDFTNQDLEARLDAIMDRMRQDADRDALAASLQEALQHLDKIERGYHEFQQAAVNVAQTYPMLIRDKLGGYEQRTLQYFGLSKKPIVLATMADRLALMQQLQGKEADATTQVIGKDGRVSLLKRRPSKSGGTGSSSNLLGASTGKKPTAAPQSARLRGRSPSISLPTTEPDQVEDLTKITTSRGNVYYVVRDFFLLAGDPEIGSAQELLGFAFEQKTESRPSSAMGRQNPVPSAGSMMSLVGPTYGVSMVTLPVVQPAAAGTPLARTQSVAGVTPAESEQSVAGLYSSESGVLESGEGKEPGLDGSIDSPRNRSPHVFCARVAHISGINEWVSGRHRGAPCVERHTRACRF
eukprot:Opistho-2@7450